MADNNIGTRFNSVTRNGVTFPYVQDEITSAKSKRIGMKYIKPDVTKKNLLDYINWLGEDDVAETLAADANQRAIGAWNSASIEDPDWDGDPEKEVVPYIGIDWDRLREIHEKQSIRSGETMASLLARIDSLNKIQMALAIDMFRGKFTPEFPDRPRTEQEIIRLVTEIQNLEENKNNLEETRAIKRAERKKAKEEKKAAAAAAGTPVPA